MDPDFFFSADAESNGTGRRSLARRCRSGELVRLRPGVYVLAAHWQKLPRWERDRARIAAAVEQGRRPRVLVQQSAAVIWGLPVIGTSPEIMLLATGDSHGRRRGELRWAERRLLEPITSREGLAVTSRAQTVLDMAAYLPFERAVPAMDHVLRLDPGQQLQGLTKDILSDLAEGLPSASKRARVRRVIDFANPLSESPGESYSRAKLHRLGFPPPELQHEFFSDAGRLLGRTDFYWKKQKLVGEFDGAVKYGPSTGGGDANGATTSGQWRREEVLTPREILLREKRREDAIRATGVGFIRWTWSDLTKPLQDPDGLMQILIRAGLPRSRRRA